MDLTCGAEGLEGHEGKGKFEEERKKREGEV